MLRRDLTPLEARVLAVLVEKDGEWWLEPASQPAQPLSDDTEVWAMIAALVRTDV